MATEKTIRLTLAYSAGAAIVGMAASWIDSRYGTSLMDAYRVGAILLVSIFLLFLGAMPDRRNTIVRENYNHNVVDEPRAEEPIDEGVEHSTYSELK